MFLFLLNSLTSFCQTSFAPHLVLKETSLIFYWHIISLPAMPFYAYKFTVCKICSISIYWLIQLMYVCRMHYITWNFLVSSDTCYARDIETFYQETFDYSNSRQGDTLLLCFAVMPCLKHCVLDSWHIKLHCI